MQAAVRAGFGQGCSLLTQALGHRYLVNVLNEHDVYMGNLEVSKLTGPPRHAHPSPSQSEAKSTFSRTQLPGLESQLCQALCNLGQVSEPLCASLAPKTGLPSS